LVGGSRSQVPKRFEIPKPSHRRVANEIQSFCACTAMRDSRIRILGYSLSMQQLLNAALTTLSGFTFQSTSVWMGPDPAAPLPSACLVSDFLFLLRHSLA